MSHDIPNWRNVCLTQQLSTLQDGYSMWQKTCTTSKGASFEDAISVLRCFQWSSLYLKAFLLDRPNSLAMVPLRACSTHCRFTDCITLWMSKYNKILFTKVEHSPLLFRCIIKHRIMQPCFGLMEIQSSLWTGHLGCWIFSRRQKNQPSVWNTWEELADIWCFQCMYKYFEEIYIFLHMTTVFTRYFAAMWNSFESNMKCK